MDNFKIVITQRAFSSISECVMFVNNVSPDAANSLYDDLMSTIKSLSTFPNKHPEIQNLIIRGAKVRKIPIHNGRYIILYKVDKDIVEIYDIIDVRKNNILSKI